MVIVVSVIERSSELRGQFIQFIEWSEEWAISFLLTMFNLVSMWVFYGNEIIAP